MKSKSIWLPAAGSWVIAILASLFFFGECDGTDLFAPLVLTEGLLRARALSPDWDRRFEGWISVDENDALGADAEEIARSALRDFAEWQIHFKDGRTLVGKMGDMEYAGLTSGGPGARRVELPFARFERDLQGIKEICFVPSSNFDIRMSYAVRIYTRGKLPLELGCLTQNIMGYCFVGILLLFSLALSIWCFWVLWRRSCRSREAKGQRGVVA